MRGGNEGEALYRRPDPVALWGGDRAQMFFFLQICNEVPGEKKKRGACRPPNGRQAPIAHPRGDRPLSPVGGATGSCVLAWPTKPIEFHSSSVRRLLNFIPPASEDLL